MGATFQITNLDARTNGKPNRRYVDEVTISYLDAAGNNQTYGTFSALTGGTVEVAIAGVVQSISVSLADGYDGDAGNTTLSVTVSDITSCAEPAALPLGGAPMSSQPAPGVRVYPNPAQADIYLEFADAPAQTDIILSDFLGRELRRVQTQGSTVVKIDIEDLTRTARMIYVTIRTKGRAQVTKRIFLVE